MTYPTRSQVRAIRQPLYQNREEADLEKRVAARLKLQPAQLRREVTNAFNRRIEAMNEEQLKAFINQSYGMINFAGLLH